jgi:hypothetical protein
MKSRKAYSDLRIMELGSMHWGDKDYSKDGKHDRLKRMNHAAAILGNMLVIHGGLNTEENYLYDQIDLFDFGKHYHPLSSITGIMKWVQALIWKDPNPKKQQNLDESDSIIKGSVLGKLQMHSMVTCQASDAAQQDRTTWLNPAPDGYVLVFGGLDEKKRSRNELWVIEPHHQPNRNEILTPAAEFKSVTSQKIYI